MPKNTAKTPPTKSEVESERQRWRKAVGFVLAALRNEAGKSQAEVAAAMGWSANRQHKLEKGKVKVEYHDIVKMTAVCGGKLERVLHQIHTLSGPVASGAFQ